MEIKIQTKYLVQIKFFSYTNVSLLNKKFPINTKKILEPN